jgi:hypothetical protein
MSSVNATAHGQCLCGVTRFEFDLPTKWVAHCHCTMCRRAHGAAFVTWVGVVDTQFRWVAKESLRWYASSPGAERGFCGQCGSPIAFRSARWPGEIHLARALIEDALDREPQVHVHTATAVPWVMLGDHLPRKLGTGA